MGLCPMGKKTIVITKLIIVLSFDTKYSDCFCVCNYNI